MSSRKRMGRRRAIVLLVVHLLIAAHIAHWLVSGETVTPIEPSEAMAFSKAGMVNAGLIFFVAAALLTAVFGRLFCGWGCHVVALQDASRWLLSKVGLRPMALRSRALAWVPVVAFLYMFVWPFAYRVATGDDLGVHGYELTTTEFWATFPGAIVAVLTFVICGFACVYFLGAKGFCTYGCPYGALFGAVERFAPFRIRVTSACEGCGHCTAVCSSNVRVHEEVRRFGMVVDPGCMKCQDCVVTCPKQALYYGAGRPAITRRSRTGAGEASRRARWSVGQEVVLASAFLGAFLTFRGLYGQLPFLLSLGLAGILAFSTLQVVRLVRRADFAWRGQTLRRGGRLTTAGRVAAALTIGVAVLWGHSAIVRAQQALAERSYRETASVRARAAQNIAGEQLALTPVEIEAVRRARANYERLESWGLLRTRDAARKQAWLDLLAGSSGDLRRHLRIAEREGADPLEVLFLRGQAASLRGDLDGALAAFSDAVRRSSAPAWAFEGLGLSQARRGELEAAVATFDDGISLHAGILSLHYNRGLAAALSGAPGRAEQDFRRALEIDSQHLPSIENLAGLLASRGRWSEARRHYERALELEADDPQTWVLLTRVLLELGERDAAREALQSARRLAPGREDIELLVRELEADG